MTRTCTSSREQCPWCGAPDKTTLCDYSYDQEPLHSVIKDTLPGSGHRFIVHECGRCRTLYQQTVLSHEEGAAFYESWPLLETDLDFILFYVQELIMIMSYFGRPAGKIAVFDYGMGWGKFCEVARTLGFDARGYDLNRHMRDHLRSRSIPVIDRLEDLEPASLDFINLEQVLEHVVAPYALVETLSRFLKKDGIIKISVPIRPLRIKAKLRHLDALTPANLTTKIMEIGPLSHLNCFNPRALKTVLADSLRLQRIQLNSLFLVFRRDCFHRVLGRPIYKNYNPRVNYLFFRKT